MTHVARTRVTALALIFVFAIAPANLLANSPTNSSAKSPAGSDLASIPKSLQCLVDQKKIPGAVTLVAREGKLIHSSVVGYQDIASRVPMRKDTIFRLYSMSKPLTSIAILMLMEQGKLELDDPASKFLPEFEQMRVYKSGGIDDMVTEPVRRPITIADLLTHTSGITYHFTGTTPVHQYYRKHGVKRNTPVGSLPTDGPAAPSLDVLVERIGKAPLLHQPGERFSYSYSTTMLSAIVERVSGMRIDRFLQERLFAPLGMVHTGFFVEGAALQRFVSNYVWTGDTLQVIETSATTDYSHRDRLLDGGGALAGTAEDYLRFAQMLANGGELDGVRLLQPQTVRLMFSNHLRPPQLPDLVVPAGVEFDFGYGVAIGNASTARAGTLPVGAGGWDGSGNTFFWADLQRKQAIVFMTQVIAPKGPPAPLKPLVYQAVYGSEAAVNVCH
jgi:CubicO group peptidase (beta-lactamase class C family)